MNSHRLTRNAIMAITQVIVSGGVLFLLYQYLLRTIGAEQVGIWAIILATASASRIGEMGFSASAVKYTARYIAVGEKRKAAEVIETTVITIGVVLACILIGSYPVIVWLMGKIVTANHIESALAILPYALGSVWVGAVAGVFVAGLDGCQRVVYRVLVSMLATVFLLLLARLWVPKYGLVGLAWAQIGQGILMMLGNWVLLRRELPSLPLFNFKWRYSLFREMFKYGFNFQISSIFGMLFDPTSKALMAKFGGLSSAAYYEMASRMVMQFRSLLVSANQVIVPQIANLQENEPQKINSAYLKSYKIIFFLSLPLYVSVAAMSPLISEIWIGHYENIFVGCTLLLATGFWFNSLTAPAYFINLGTGILFFNTISNVIIGILNGVLGYSLGIIFGGWGVVIGYNIALVIGGSLISFGYHHDQQIPLKKLFPIGCRLFFVICLFGLLISWVTFYNLDNMVTPFVTAGLSFIACSMPVSIAFWIHPLRKQLFSKVMAENI